MVFPWNDETFFLGRRPAWFIAVFINYNAFRSTSQCFTIVEGFLSNLSMLIYIVCIRFNFPVCNYSRASNVYTIKKNLTVPGYKINLLDEFLLKKKREKIATSKKKSYKQLSRVNHRADKHRAKTRALEQKVSSWPSHWSRSRVTLVFLFSPHFYIKSDNLLLFTNYSMALLRHTVFSLASHSLSLSLSFLVFFFLIFLLVRFNFLRASFRF